MADRQFVVFKSEKSAFDNCICNACHHVGFVLKLELPETTYTRSGKLNTKYRSFWMCKKCAAELSVALEWEDEADGGQKTSD